MVRLKFKIPLYTPSSLYFKDLEISNEPKAKVKYFCKASFKCKNATHDMSHKQILVVR